MNEGVVSKETVVLRRWGSSIQKFGFINGVDNVNWPPYQIFVTTHPGCLHKRLEESNEKLFYNKQKEDFRACLM